jgi:hypothetical protein
VNLAPKTRRPRQGVTDAARETVAPPHQHCREQKPRSLLPPVVAVVAPGLAGLFCEWQRGKRVDAAEVAGVVFDGLARRCDDRSAAIAARFPRGGLNPGVFPAVLATIHRAPCNLAPDVSVVAPCPPPAGAMRSNARPSCPFFMTPFPHRRHVMQDTPAKQSPKAHEDEYRNKQRVDQLPRKGDKRQEKRSSEDLTAGRIDEKRHRPGKESRDES